MKDHRFDYFEIFQRNIGILTKDEQVKLQRSAVLIAGIGGVGGPSALTLARMGIGRLILADLDAYSVSNLNRQMPSRLDDIGKPKTHIVASHIRDIHPFIDVVTADEGITKRNVDDLVQRSDLVITSMDGCMTMVLQQALQRHEKMGVTASPMLNTIVATCFPPGGNYLSEIYPFDVDESNLEQSNRLYYAWIERMTRNKSLFQPGYFPVISAGTVTAAGFIGFFVVNYLARCDMFFPAFPTTKVLNTKSMKMKTEHRVAHLFFKVFRLFPFTRDLFVKRIKIQVERKLKSET
jgi:hypothetical protein